MFIFKKYPTHTKKKSFIRLFGCVIYWVQNIILSMILREITTHMILTEIIIYHMHEFTSAICRHDVCRRVTQAAISDRYLGVTTQSSGRLYTLVVSLICLGNTTRKKTNGKKVCNPVIFQEQAWRWCRHLWKSLLCACRGCCGLRDKARDYFCRKWGSAGYAACSWQYNDGDDCVLCRRVGDSLTRCLWCR